MIKVSKAVIPAAGMGTRFLPATKASPKEMLPLVDKPIIQQVVEEAVDSGIGQIVLVTGKGKRAIEDHFDISWELESHLASRGQQELLERVRRVSRMVELAYVRQKEPQGLGHAVLCARPLVGEEPFAVLLGDDIIDSTVPCLAQLMAVHRRLGGAVLALQQVPPEETHRYGVIQGEEVEPGTYRVRRMVEKPPPGSAPSNLAVIGRYVLPPEIFDLIASLEPGVGQEYQLTDALDRMAREGKVFGVLFEGVRHDAGDRLGFIKANIHYALKDPDLREGLLAYLTGVLEGGEG